MARRDAIAETTVRALFARWTTPVTMSLASVALTTLLVWWSAPSIEPAHLIFIYLTPTAFIAIRYGSMAALVATVASGLAAAYLLYTPRYSFAVSSVRDVTELVLFAVMALLAARVVSGFASDRRIKRRRNPAPPRVPSG